MTIEEAIRTAIEYEVKVRGVYMYAHQRATDPVGRRVFRVLADEERLHVEYLKDRLDQWERTGTVRAERLDTAIPSKNVVEKGIEKLEKGMTASDSGDELRMLEKAREVVHRGACDLLILDEINIAVDFALLPVEDVLELLGEKPENMEVILTGRNAPRELMDMAHLVTEMREIKHPYQQGIEMRKGIEY